MIEHSAADKAVVDDELFTRLLEAAYLIQERNQAPQSPTPADFSQIVGQVLETERLLHSRDLTVDAALQLIANRLCECSSASGVAIGRIQDHQLGYVAASGHAARLAGAVISADASSSWRCLSKGECVQSYCTQAETRIDLQLCKKLGAESYLAVPVFHDSAVAGVIEVFFSRAGAFDDTAVRTAELMAGLVTEVLTQNAERELKEELAAERATVLSALESLKPQLRKLVGENSSPEPPPARRAEEELCRACGHSFVGQEMACGVCGALRATGKYPGTELQSKWAALWERQLIGTDHGPSFRREPVDEHLVNNGNELAPPQLDRTAADVEDHPLLPMIEAELEDVTADQDDTDLVPGKPIEDVPDVADISEHPEWQSARRTKEWLRAQAPPRSPVQQFRKLLATRTGDVSLLLAGVVFAIVLVWGFWPQPSTNRDAGVAAVPVVKRKARQKPPQLSVFERLLVATGLAVPPPPAEYMGDPNAKVWLDLQTGLYYCPGAALYAATAKGRYTSQSDAQQEAFEPAARKPCD